MIPYSVTIRNNSCEIHDGIPFTGYANHALHLPDGRRLMGGKTTFGRLLKPYQNRMYLYGDVKTKVVHQHSTFPEGSQPWVSISENDQADDLLLVYFEAFQPDQDIMPVTWSDPPVEFENVFWQLPFQKGFAKASASHGGLAVMRPQQMVTLFQKQTDDSEELIFRVISSVHYDQTKLRFGI